jgi:hypothetical protein
MMDRSLFLRAGQKRYLFRKDFVSFAWLPCGRALAKQTTCLFCHRMQLFAKQVWSNSLGALDLLLVTPLGDGGVVAAQKHLGHI